MATVTLTIANPTTRRDGSSLSPADIKSLRVYRTDGSAAQKLIATVPGSPTTYEDSNVSPGPYGYNVSVVDELGQEGDQSPTFPVIVPVPEAAPSAPTITSAVLS